MKTRCLPLLILAGMLGLCRLAVGAPPDSLNTAGQNWGLAGFNAAGLEVQSFGPFRDMLRASMRHAGAIRLDHVLGLNRLYLVPHGFAANNGAYVQMPFAALLAATFYLVLSGAEVAPQRSFIMIAIVLIGIMVGRAALTLRNLAIAAQLGNGGFYRPRRTDRTGGGPRRGRRRS